MYEREIPRNLLSLRVGMDATTLFPSKGIEESGPLEVRNPSIRLRTVYSDKDQSQVQTLVQKIKSELRDVFRINIEEEIDSRVTGNILTEIGDLAREDAKRPQDHRPIYLVVTEKGSKDNPSAPYYKIKSELLSNNILSQFVTTDTLNNQRRISSNTTFRNIALGIFVKADNIPWHLQMPITLNEQSEESLIIGIGITSVRHDIFSKETDRYVGYISFYNSRGVWKMMFPILSPVDKIQEKIQQSLQEGINYTISKEVNKLDVIIHYAGKDIQMEEEKAITETLTRYEKDTGFKINYAIVRLIKSAAYRLFSNRDNGYAPMGTYVNFENGLLLINTTGILGKNATPMGVNVPILASIKKTNLQSTPDLMHNIVYSVVGLARINWRGVNAFNFEPATTKYAREIAYIMAHLDQKIFKNQISLAFLQSKLWFI
jgi:hypothetical protein